MHPKFVEGFMKKCAALGVDPEAVVVVADQVREQLEIVKMAQTQHVLARLARPLIEKRGQNYVFPSNTYGMPNQEPAPSQQQQDMAEQAKWDTSVMTDAYRNLFKTDTPENRAQRKYLKENPGALKKIMSELPRAGGSRPGTPSGMRTDRYGNIQEVPGTPAQPANTAWRPLYKGIEQGEMPEIQTMLQRKLMQNAKVIDEKGGPHPEFLKANPPAGQQKVYPGQDIAADNSDEQNARAAQLAAAPAAAPAAPALSDQQASFQKYLAANPNMAPNEAGANWKKEQPVNTQFDLPGLRAVRDKAQQNWTGIGKPGGGYQTRSELDAKQQAENKRNVEYAATTGKPSVTMDGNTYYGNDQIGALNKNMQSPEDKAVAGRRAMFDSLYNSMQQDRDYASAKSQPPTPTPTPVREPTPAQTPMLAKAAPPVIRPNSDQAEEGNTAGERAAVANLNRGEGNTAGERAAVARLKPTPVSPLVAKQPVVTPVVTPVAAPAAAPVATSTSASATRATPSVLPTPAAVTTSQPVTTARPSDVRIDRNTNTSQSIT